MSTKKDHKPTKIMLIDSPFQGLPATLFLSFFIVSLCLDNSPAFGGNGNNLFYDAPGSEVVFAQQEKDKKNPTIKRGRYILVNVDLLRSQEGALLLNLFGDVLLTALKDRMEVRSEHRYTWYGHIEGRARSQVILVVEDGSMAGELLMAGNLYQIRAIGGGVHGVYEIDQSAFPPHADPIPVP